MRIGDPFIPFCTGDIHSLRLVVAKPVLDDLVAPDVEWREAPHGIVATSHECRVGFGYSGITGAKDGIEVEQLCFVPRGETLELRKTTVRNQSDRPREITLFSFVEFCFFEALNDMTNYQRTFSIGEVEVDGSAIYHKAEYRERRKHYTLLAWTRDVDGFDTSGGKLVGVHNRLHEPAAVMQGGCTDSIAHGWNPIGAHEIKVTLAPGSGKKQGSFTSGRFRADLWERFLNMPSATAKRTRGSMPSTTFRTKGRIVRPAKGMLAPAEVDKIVRRNGGRPMTAEESGEFERFFKDPYP